MGGLCVCGPVSDLRVMRPHATMTVAACWVVCVCGPVSDLRVMRPHATMTVAACWVVCVRVCVVQCLIHV